MLMVAAAGTFVLVRPTERRVGWLCLDLLSLTAVRSLLFSSVEPNARPLLDLASSSSSSSSLIAPCCSAVLLPCLNTTFADVDAAAAADLSLMRPFSPASLISSPCVRSDASLGLQRDQVGTSQPSRHVREYNGVTAQKQGWIAGLITILPPRPQVLSTHKHKTVEGHAVNAQRCW